MSYLPMIDISQWQGKWGGYSEPVVAIKMSGGDNGLYYDSQATGNYNAASAAGKVIIGYHFAGGTDPIAEADFFIKGMSPLAEADILCLDWEVQHPDPVGWCLSFVNHVHDVTGVWPLVYMNTSTCTAHDWSPVLNTCGLWIADYRFTPDQDVPCGHPYLIHQYTSTPIDRDAVFVTLDQLKAYGYHIPAPAPIPAAPATPPVAPEPAPAPTETNTPKAPPISSPPVQETPSVIPVETLWERFLGWLVKILGIK
jgi:hypothetical protein